MHHVLQVCKLVKATCRCFLRIALKFQGSLHPVTNFKTLVDFLIKIKIYQWKSFFNDIFYLNDLTILIFIFQGPPRITISRNAKDHLLLPKSSPYIQITVNQRLQRLCLANHYHYSIYSSPLTAEWYRPMIIIQRL